MQIFFRQVLCPHPCSTRLVMAMSSLSQSYGNTLLAHTHTGYVCSQHSSREQNQQLVGTSQSKATSTLSSLPWTAQAVALHLCHQHFCRTYSGLFCRLQRPIVQHCSAQCLVLVYTNCHGQQGQVSLLHLIQNKQREHSEQQSFRGHYSNEVSIAVSEINFKNLKSAMFLGILFQCPSKKLS